MVLLQFQFIDADEDDISVFPEFFELLINKIYASINTKINRKKLDIRLNYLLKTVNWIQWEKGRKYNISVKNIMEAIYNSLKVVPYKNNLWKVEIDTKILIPYSKTPIDKLIRFLNYGDTKYGATGIFTRIENEFNYVKLIALWKYFAYVKFQEISEVKIITSS